MLRALRNYSGTGKCSLEFSERHACLVTAERDWEIKTESLMGKSRPSAQGGDKGFAPGGPGTTQMNQLSVISKGIMSRKANDWAEIRNPGAEGGGKPLQGEVECQGMFGASQKGAASRGGKSCVKGTIVESSKPAGLQEDYRRAPDEKAAAVAWLLCQRLTQPDRGTNSTGCALAPVISPPAGLQRGLRQERSLKEPGAWRPEVKLQALVGEGSNWLDTSMEFINSSRWDF